MQWCKWESFWDDGNRISEGCNLHSYTCIDGLLLDEGDGEGVGGRVAELGHLHVLQAIQVHDADSNLACPVFASTY